MELRDYFKVLRRRWISIVAISLLCATAAAVLTALQTPMYASNARLFISTSERDTATAAAGGQFSAERVKSYADLITSRELANRVITDLGLDEDPTSLVGQVSATVGVETVNLTLTVTDTDASDAQQIAQVYAEQLVDLVRELETPPGATNAPIKATIVDAASFSEAPVSPDPVRNIGLGLFVGLVLGFGLAVLREMLDTRITSLEDISDITDAPALGAIVHDPAATKTPLLTQIPMHSPRAESFRVLRTNLQFVDVDNKRKVFALTSALPGEGKTSTAVNLAISLAQGGSRTLLIECDLRRPKAAGRLELDAAVGVTSVLVGRVKLTDAVQIHEASGLEFIASGPIPPNPAELLQSQAMSELLDQARDSYDVVILDTPPLLPVTDAAILSVKADGAMLVVSHRTVTKEQVRHSIERLAQVDAYLVGIVLNKVPSKRKTYGYGYGYGYGYAPDPEPLKRGKRSSKHAGPPTTSDHEPDR
jgi:capsular exopolysaccharide synthesis family protein